MSRRGFSLIEVLLATSLLALLMGLIFVTFNVGSRSFRSTHLQSELRGDMGVLTNNLSRELERSIYSSLSLTSQGLSVLSAQDSSGRFVIGADGRPIWQRFVIYYRFADEVRRRDLELAPPLTAAAPIENCDLGSGLQPLSFYLDGEGRALARNVARFAPSVPEAGRLEIELGFEMPRPGNLPPLRLEAVTGFFFRNQ